MSGFIVLDDMSKLDLEDVEPVLGLDEMFGSELRINLIGNLVGQLFVAVHDISILNIQVPVGSDKRDK